MDCTFGRKNSQKIHNVKPFSIISKKYLTKDSTIFIYKWKNVVENVIINLLIYLNETDNGTMNNVFIIKGVKIFLNDFEDKYFKEWIELPPLKNDNLTIDLVVDVAPIAKAPYHHFLV